MIFVVCLRKRHLEDSKCMCTISVKHGDMPSSIVRQVLTVSVTEFKAGIGALRSPQNETRFGLIESSRSHRSRFISAALIVDAVY